VWLNSVVRRLAVKPGHVRVTLADGELVEAEAVVCAIPAGPLREIEISGVSDARLASLRALRQALAAKVVVSYDSPFWQENGQNGLAETEGLFGSTWPQGPGVLSLLVPPERLSAFLAAPAPARAEAVLDGLARLYGEPARVPGALLERAWGVDPFTRGYMRAGRPDGRVGPPQEPTSRPSMWPAQTTGSRATEGWCAPGAPPPARQRAHRSEKCSGDHLSFT
jgi:monoamine oxidase